MSFFFSRVSIGFWRSWRVWCSSIRTQYGSVTKFPQLVRMFPYLLHKRISPLSVHQRSREEVLSPYIRHDEGERISVRSSFISGQRIVNSHRRRQFSSWFHVLGAKFRSCFDFVKLLDNYSYDTSKIIWRCGLGSVDCEAERYLLISSLVFHSRCRRHPRLIRQQHHRRTLTLVRYLSTQCSFYDRCYFPPRGTWVGSGSCDCFGLGIFANENIFISQMDWEQDYAVSRTVHKIG